MTTETLVRPSERAAVIPWNTLEEKAYEPSVRQVEFHQSPARYKLYGGAVGGGKTTALAIESLLLSWCTPNNEGIVGRRDFDDLRRTTYAEVLKWCPSELIKQHHKSEHWLELVNGSVIHFMELKDAGGLKNMNLGWFAIDQAEEVPYDSFMWLQSRLRRTGIPEYYGLLSANPEPGWVKDHFITSLDRDSVFIPALPEDNPHLPSDYVQSLLERWPEVYVRKLLLGHWDVVENAIYPQLDRGKHLIALPERVMWDQGAIGIDYGTINLSAVVAVQRESSGRYWVRHCWTKAGGDPVPIEDAARSMKVRYEIKRGRVDPIQDVMAFNLGFNAAKKGPYRSERIGHVTKLLNADALHFDMNGEGVPQLFDEMLSYHWDKSESDFVTKWEPVRKNDDRVAALEYAVEELTIGPNYGGDLNAGARPYAGAARRGP